VILKRLIILGSTGSIGKSSLDVILQKPEHFKVVGLAAGRSGESICEQIALFHPEAVSLRDHLVASEVRKQAGSTTRIYDGFHGMIDMIRSLEADSVVNGLVGSVGMVPTLVSLESGKDVLLANKETMVIAGQLVMEAANRHGKRVVPIDSEMSAIYQCLKGGRHSEIKRLILTASGGPFIDYSSEQLAHVTVEQALNHPTWSMGTKNTIDSATLMNKGLEVIESSRLFNVPGEKIDVTIHRSSMVHSFVEFIDGSILSQLSKPDMRLAIQYAMTDPERQTSPYGGMDFSKAFSLSFEPPDVERFPCLGLAYQTLSMGGTAPAVMNGANESAVQAFVNGRISFKDIPNAIKKVVEEHEFIPEPTIEELITADNNSKRHMEEILNKI
jgi:1-deoxy-D-xylulose-5-phosphate reductoisomerase